MLHCTSFIVRHSCEVISDSISEFILWSQLDDDNVNGSSDSVLIIIHANQLLQVDRHLACGDVNSARIASADVKKYACIAVFIGTFHLVLILVLRLCLASSQ